MSNPTTTEHRRALDGLDRLLALRPEDLDGWEAEAADGLEADARASIEADDASFEALLAAWTAAGDGDVPDLSAADFLGLPQQEASRLAKSPARHRTFHRDRTGVPGWATPVALAACLAIVAFGAWQLNALAPDDGVRLKEVTPSTSADLELQFSVEEGALVTPGTAGATLGADARLALRVDVAAGGGHLSVFEVVEGAAPVLIESAQVDDSGVVELGGGRLWGPTTRGTSATYLAVMTSTEVEATDVLVAGILADPDRPDRWPRPVLAADWFAVHWE